MQKSMIFLFSLLVFVTIVCSMVYIQKSQDGKRQQARENIIAISTIFSASAAFAFGVLSLNIMRAQQRNEERQLQIQIMEHQPIFQVSYNLYKSKPESKIYDCEEMTVSNSGERILSLDNISNRTYVELCLKDFNQPSSQKSIFIRINYYYSATSQTGNLQGDLLYSFGSEHIKNNENYSNLYFECLDFGKRHEFQYIESKLHKIVVIDYTDIYSDKHRFILDSNKIIDEKQFLQIEELASADCNKRGIDVQDLNFEHISQICPKFESFIKGSKE